MSQPELLARVAAVLEEAGIEYMVTGSIVSSLQGEPRSTHDIDLVVAIDAADVASLAAAFRAPDFYLDEASAREAIERRNDWGMFSLTAVAQGDKVDFWVLPDDPYEQVRFQRRQMQLVIGLQLPVSTPEDTILSKLRWAKLAGGSEKQMGDARSVYEVQFRSLDQQYLDRWAAELGVADLLARLRDEAEPL